MATVSGRRLFLCLALSTAAAFGQVTVDGNLTDLRAVAQGRLADPPNDVCSIGRSGFDYTEALVFYDVLEDALYFGLDLLDVPPGIGTLGTGIPGDADGDGNPDSPSGNLNCVALPFIDENGVGPDEFYRVFIDSDLDGFIDVRVEYSDGSLKVFAGTGHTQIPGATGIIQLGMAGWPGGSPSIPDADENGGTTDIEIRVDHASTLIAGSTAIDVTVESGSLVEGLPEDRITGRIRCDVRSCSAGTVNGGAGSVMDVVRVNGDAGAPPDRIVTIAVGVPVSFTFDAPAAGPSPARYVTWAWPSASTRPVGLTVAGTYVGCTVNPTPLSFGQWLPQPLACIRDPRVPASACRGTHEAPSPSSVPWFITRSRGFRHEFTLTLQGLVEDQGAANSLRVSVTNAVRLVVP